MSNSKYSLRTKVLRLVSDNSVLDYTHYNVKLMRCEVCIIEYDNKCYDRDQQFFLLILRQHIIRNIVFEVQFMIK